MNNTKQPLMHSLKNIFDVFFNDNDNSNNKGFNYTYDQCLSYIDGNNGTSESYFKDYKGGNVSIVNNDTGEKVYETLIF